MVEAEANAKSTSTRAKTTKETQDRTGRTATLMGGKNVERNEEKQQTSSASLPTHGKDRITYNRVVLHDVSPNVPANRVFFTSIKKSGFNQQQVDDMNMSAAKRKKQRLLPIYEPPRHFQVLAKVETTCSNQEAMGAVKVLRNKIVGLVKSGLAVEDAVAWVVANYPGHVRHGLAYQLKSLPPRKTIFRLDRTRFAWSESDEQMLSSLDKAREEMEVGTALSVFVRLTYR